jgi:hypothetical protein
MKRYLICFGQYDFLNKRFYVSNIEVKAYDIENARDRFFLMPNKKLDKEGKHTAIINIIELGAVKRKSKYVP